MLPLRTASIALRKNKLQTVRWSFITRLSMPAYAAHPSRMVSKSDAQRPAPPAVRLLATDELGAITVVEAADLAQLDAARVVNRWGTLDRQQEATSFAAAYESIQGDHMAAVGRATGNIDSINHQTGQQRCSIPSTDAQMASDAPDSAASSSSRSLLLSSAVVGLQVISSWGSEGDPSATRSAALLSCTESGLVRLYTGSGSTWRREQQLEVGSSCTCIDLDESSSRMAVGQEGRELSVWDLRSGQATYHAKGNKPNRISLVDKPHNTAAAFIPESQGQRIAVGTQHHKLRLYDVRQRRPALDVVFGDARVTTLAPMPGGDCVWAANGTGHIEMLDLRAGKLAGSLKGAGGSVRCLALHPSQPFIASVGLDRFLRVHHTGSRKLLARVYLKQQLTQVAFVCPESSAAAAMAATAVPAGSPAEISETAAEAEDTAVGRDKTSERVLLPKKQFYQSKRKRKAA